MDSVLSNFYEKCCHRLLATGGISWELQNIQSDMDEAGQRDGKGFPLPASKEQGHRQGWFFSAFKY